MKKRVGLLAALAMCITVGGVYATWNYGESTAALSVQQTAAVGLTGTATASSSLKIKDGSNSLAFKVDDTTNDHIADALVSNGSITVVYEATAPASYDVTIYCNVTVTAADGKDYLVTTLEKNALNTTITLNNQTSAEWTVTAEQLKIALGDYIKSEACHLPTIEDYTTFATMLEQTVSIQVHFSTTPIA